MLLLSKQKIHKDDPVFISQHYFFGSALKEHNTKHHICKLLESDEVTNLKIVQSLTNPLQARDFLLNYTTGQIPYDKKNVEIFLITQRNYGEVNTSRHCFVLSISTLCAFPSRNWQPWEKGNSICRKSNLLRLGERS